MPSPHSLPVQLSQRHRDLLDVLLRRHQSSQQLVDRIRILRLADEGLSNNEIQRQLGLHRGTARTWRKRWVDAADCLEAAQTEGASDAQLLDLIETILADAPRSGAPATFTPEVVVQLVALACEDPQTTDQPFSHWSPTELAREAIGRGIVATISPRSVGRFLKGGRSQAPSQSLLAQPHPRGPRGVPGAGEADL